MNSRTRKIALCVGVLTLSTLVPGALAQAWSQFREPLPMIMRSVLPAADGRMGHIAHDPTSGRLYFAVPRNNTIEVLDATGMKMAQSVSGLNEPNNLLLLNDKRTLLASGGGGTVWTFKLDAQGQATADKSYTFDGEADPMIVDPKSGRLWVGHGWFLSSLDLATGDKSKPLALNAAPEGMAIETSGNRLFVNIATKGRIVVIDREKGEVAATWTLKNATGNNAMAFDEANKRLFVVSRNPGKLIVLDSTDGKEITRLDCADDVDDLWFDPRGKRLYASGGGGGGKITMVRQDAPDTYVVEANVNTAAGTRTSVFIPQTRRLVATAPKLPDTQAFVYIYLIPDEKDRLPTAAPAQVPVGK
ncbi:MAG: hypothetical protein K2W85_08200 [Phycisphaerales bacterium]|nr:hypothetical protein [Phycisphaerales bacterium]